MFPRWISWLFLLFLGYLIYTGNRAAHAPSAPAAPPTQTPATTNADLSNYPKLQAFTNGDRWQRAINPEYVGTAKITDSTLGHGTAIQCGDHVTIHLRGTLTDGANFDAAHEESKPLGFYVGDAPYAVLNEALIGMRAGGVRQISAPPQQVFPEGSRKTTDDVLLRVTLDSIGSEPTEGERFGNRIVVDHEGTGNAASCGTPIHVQLRLWNSDGSAGYTTSQPLTLTPGKDRLPPGLAHGLAGMRVDETRSLVIPATNEEVRGAIPQPIREALDGDAVTLLTATRVK